MPQPEDVRISDWALLRRRGGRRLIVALSGVDCPPGSFAYYNSLALPDSDQLLLNSPDNGWYFGGVPLGQGAPTLEATWTFLQNISADYDETVLIGGSMGAYGALLYGCELPRAHVLVVSRMWWKLPSSELRACNDGSSQAARSRDIGSRGWDRVSQPSTFRIWI